MVGRWSSPEANAGPRVQDDKDQASSDLAEIPAPITRRQIPSASYTFGDFMERILLPFYTRKWERIHDGLFGYFYERRASTSAGGIVFAADCAL